MYFTIPWPDAFNRLFRSWHWSWLLFYILGRRPIHLESDFLASLLLLVESEHPRRIHFALLQHLSRCTFK